MLKVLADRTFRRLFAAQIIALLGTGLLTVALGLLALDLAGGGAALILGTILTIKMMAYVLVAPVAAALAERLPRRGVLVGLDLVRAGAVLCLPFVTTVGQVYALIIILQSASAAFTPAFQATIPDVLPEEERYTRALSLSRLAYDLESLASPMLAAFLLVFVSHDSLFAGAVAGFLGSAVLVLGTRLPAPRGSTGAGFLERTTKGIGIYLATPRLRGLLALNLVAAAGGAMVIVNTVVLVRIDLGLGESALALTLAAFGAGSMTAALALPRLLDTGWRDRTVMAGGAALLAGSMGVFGLALTTAGPGWGTQLAAWFLGGLGYSAILTPVGLLLRRSAQEEDRGSIFAAQFALSHVCWLVTYPLSGWLMTAFGGAAAALALSALGAVGLALALRAWPADDPQILAHRHDDLPHDHPHLSGHGDHAHDFRIDGLHRHWPVR